MSETRKRRVSFIMPSETPTRFGKDERRLLETIFNGDGDKADGNFSLKVLSNFYEYMDLRIKKFIEENTLVMCFFSLDSNDVEFELNKQHIDYLIRYLPYLKGVIDNMIVKDADMVEKN